jgi:uncharacterized protein YcfJ
MTVVAAMIVVNDTMIDRPKPGKMNRDLMRNVAVQGHDQLRLLMGEPLPWTLTSHHQVSRKIVVSARFPMSSEDILIDTAITTTIAGAVDMAPDLGQGNGDITRSIIIITVESTTTKGPGHVRGLRALVL